MQESFQKRYRYLFLFKQFRALALNLFPCIETVMKEFKQRYYIQIIMSSKKRNMSQAGIVGSSHLPPTSPPPKFPTRHIFQKNRGGRQNWGNLGGLEDFKLKGYFFLNPKLGGDDATICLHLSF
jgi:hypothetical protein